MLHMNFFYIWIIGSREEELSVFPYISPIGAIFEMILFPCAKYLFTNPVPRILYIKYQSIWIASL